MSHQDKSALGIYGNTTPSPPRASPDGIDFSDNEAATNKPLNGIISQYLVTTTTRISTANDPAIDNAYVLLPPMIHRQRNTSSDSTGNTSLSLASNSSNDSEFISEDAVTDVSASNRITRAKAAHEGMQINNVFMQNN